MAKVLVIIPTYNERENVINLLPDVLKELEQDVYDTHILVVDDNSPDGTADAVVELSKFFNNVHLVKRPAKLGLGSAYIDGFRWGMERGFDVFLTMDADFSHSPSYLSSLVEAVEEGYDVAIASRYVKGGSTVGWPWRRKLVSRGANTLVRLFLRIGIKDVTSGYRALSKRSVAELLRSELRSEGYAFLLESIYRLSLLGYRAKEVPFIYQSRKVGRTKLSTKETLDYLFHLLRLAIKG